MAANPLLAGLWGCKNRAHSISRPKVVKAVPNQGLVFSVSCDRFLIMFVMYVLFVLGCQYSTDAIDCLERLLSEMTYYVLSVTLNPTHSLTHSTRYYSLTLQRVIFKDFLRP